MVFRNLRWITVVWVPDTVETDKGEIMIDDNLKQIVKSLRAISIQLLWFQVMVAVLLLLILTAVFIAN